MRPLAKEGLFFILCCGVLFTEAQLPRCGVKPLNQTSPKRMKRVVGGKEAAENSWPWILNFIVKKTSRQECAGSIIDREWILTSGHCFISSESVFPLTNYSYHVADHKLNFSDTYEYQIVPSELYVHPKFILGDSKKPGDYDIALVKLATPLNYTEHVRPICLPNKNTVFSKNDTCYLAGWGNNNDTNDYHRSPVLNEARLELVSLERCNSNVSYKGVVSDRFFCAGFEKGGIDGCFGDSGGPLQCEKNGSWIQAGIMAWGIGCARPNNFGVYTDVRVLLPFVEAIMAGPNKNLSAYYQQSLMDIVPDRAAQNSSNLFKLFTKEGEFSDVDLVRNLQLVPDQIKLLNRTRLMDLSYVSDMENFPENETTLRNITTVFLEQSNRLTIFVKAKELARELNITFERVVQLSNLSKNDLLNSKANILQKVKKSFYISIHLDKLRMYQKELAINLNISKTTAAFNILTVNDLKNLSDTSLRQMLVNENREVFIKTIAFRNISSFFKIGLSELKNKTVTDVVVENFNVRLGDFASTCSPAFTAQQLNVLKGVKMSNCSCSVYNMSICDIAMTILTSREINECMDKGSRCSKHATCSNFIGSFACTCSKGYVGNGMSCVSGNTIYKSEIHINNTFSPNLNNPYSYEYVNLAEKIQIGISQAVTKSMMFPGFVGTQVTGFKSGSVLASYVVVFSLGERDQVNTSQLTDVITKAIQNGSVLAAAVSSSPLELSNLCDLGSSNCHTNASCNVDDGRIICKCRPNFYGNGFNCTDPCEKHKCSANSQCHRSLNGTAICMCDINYVMKENGECKKSTGECNENDGECKENNEHEVALIAVSCIAALFLVLLIIVTCRLLYHSNKKQAFEVNSHGQTETGQKNSGYNGMSMDNLSQPTGVQANQILF